MTIDEKLNKKVYYQTLVNENEYLHSMKILGDLYMEEQKKELSDLSYIRFSQGEFYFHNRDYEAAIFKWENISNELEPWAKKNMADAYFELELLSTAEDIYRSIHTDSDVLKTEVLLQLFSLYIEQGKLERAVEVIKEAVILNPDYSEVTEIARSFFEEYQDWHNAVELAVNESVRTGDLRWYGILHTYVEQGKMMKMPPSDFSEVLHTLYKVDLMKFEVLSVSFWKCYKNSEFYFSWLNEINQILLHKDGSKAHKWHELSELYHHTYFELIDGKYLIKELSHLIPDHLTNWLKLADSSHALFAAASTLAWSEIFTSGIEPEIINKAESLLKKTARDGDELEEGYLLFESIAQWAKKNGIELGKRFGWMVKELLNLNDHHILLAGTDYRSKLNFIQSTIGEKTMHNLSSIPAIYKDSDTSEIMEISDEEFREIANLSEQSIHPQAIIQYKQPMSFLQDNKIAIIDTPAMTGEYKFRNEVYQYLQFADSLLFILNSDELFSEKELEAALKIREKAPNLPIHFLINNTDQEVVDQVSAHVHTYFPKVKLLAISTADFELNGLSNLIAEIKNNRNLEEERISKVHQYIRRTIKYLLERRVEMENSYIDSIKWNEEMVTKLNGATNQLNDLEEEKIRTIKRAFRKMVDDMKLEVTEEIPSLLRTCSEHITENCDFGKIHIKLNDEMNDRIQNYMDEKELPSIHDAFQNWISDARIEFEQSQSFLNEMSIGFNDLYNDEKIKLDCDFKLLDDWRRDADRMTRGSIQLEKMNILMRFTPAQFLLKSAGKLFNALPQNKALILNKYKQYIEHEDYSSVSAAILNQLLQPFELFEKALDRDIHMFFDHPFCVLNEAAEEANKEIEWNKESLREMRMNPETYRDPITLFQLKLRQFEWMTNAGKALHQYQ
ncbi:GTP-binding protein [Cytobacillus massiliigabonensis]|uniref:GTP-binding protein n=1 Tax=Cytobacillus massiliigabonensis TaxID=1871011 RepID=UPI000C864260|nr:GTP-binding protein [Cytobacillus massiliigabonensis]